MPFALRPCEPADFETLYEIDRACYPPGIAYSRRTLRSFLAQPNALCLVAESAAETAPEVIGFIVGETHGRDAHIITLDVVASHRRRGVGTALLLALEQRFRERGVRTVELETATANEAGVAFWRRHGYRTAGVLRGYYPGRLDAYAMRKAL